MCPITNSVDQNHVCVAGLSRNMFRLLWNIPNVVDITYNGHGFEWHIGTKYIVVVAVKYVKVSGFWEEAVKVITWLIIRITALFWFVFLLVIIGDFNLHCENMFRIIFDPITETYCFFPTIGTVHAESFMGSI